MVLNFNIEKINLEGEETMTNYDLMLEKMCNLGMDLKWSKMFIKKFADDEKAFSFSEEEKKWAMERGFFPGRIALYDLNEENYKNYVPDYNYFMLHPLNHHFKIWVNDKLTLKYVLNSNGCSDVMPEYYLYIENDGSYTYLMDCPDYIQKDENFLWNLLCDKKILAMKPNSGTSGGLGFIKLEIRKGLLYENNKLIDNKRFSEICESMRNYIVTEYVYQHSELAKIWPNSECTLRVIMCKDVKSSFYEKDSWSCAISYARFGSSVSGGASNLSSGGIGIGFNFENGKFNENGIRYKKFCSNGVWKIKKHPDTEIDWSLLGLPNYDVVKKKIYQVCHHVSSLSYLGLDIIISENGMKLCEINTHPAMDYEQVMNGPTLLKEKVKKFFINKGIYKFNAQDFYRAYLESQNE